MSAKADSEKVEQRRKQRIVIPEHPEIMDAHTAEVIGQLVNLSADGLMMVSSHCVERGRVCQIRIPLIRGGKAMEIVVGAESLWCEDANGSGSYWTGFHIIDISPEDRQILNSVVGD